MDSNVDWGWKLREAIERIRTRNDHIGRKTGAPFLAIVYPPEQESAVLKEWRVLLDTLGPEYVVRRIDVLNASMEVVESIGGESIVASINDPMAGSNPESELGQMWVDAITTKIKDEATSGGDKKVVVVLERLAALYPATGPRAVMQELWDSEQSKLDGPIIVLIPGTLTEPRVYSFLNQREELMYRGDLL
jgi:hypothetical protein